MLYKFEVDTSNAVFDGSMTDVANELANEFAEVLEKLIVGASGGPVLDTNGNTVGSWSYEAKP